MGSPLCRAGWLLGATEVSPWQGRKTEQRDPSLRERPETHPCLPPLVAPAEGAEGRFWPAWRVSIG